MTKVAGFYNRVFFVPNKSGGWRPVIDLSALSKLFIKPTFAMETAESIRLALPINSWVVSIDLHDAFFHIPIHPAARKYMRFVSCGQVYQFRALPFGLKSAPWIFSMVVRELQVLAHKEGIFLHQYLDDWVIRHADPRVLLSQLHFVLELCHKMGFNVSRKKSELVPTPDFLLVDIATSRQ
jgi:hypothetical protein